MGQYERVLCVASGEEYLEIGRYRLADCHLELATREIAHGRNREALEHVRRAAVLQPERPVVLASLGALSFYLEDDDDAEQLLRRAVRDDPDLFLAHFTLARLYRHQERREEALTALERCLLVPYVRNTMILERILAEALTMAPEDTTGYADYLAGRAFYLGREYAKAGEHLLKAEERGLGHLAELHFLLGRVALHEGRPEEEARRYRLAVAANPRHIEALREVAREN
jgi:tetratricopeptide (TPR) repeat protein